MLAHRYIVLWGLLLTSLVVLAQEKSTFMVLSYNVENFFDARHDTLKNDQDFLPDGKYHWTYTKMNRKAEQIAKVIANIGGWSTPAVIGLCEVENEYCIRHLCYELRPFCAYHFLHYESPDERGVDVALLYDPNQFRIIDSAALFVDLGEDYTRDILYAKGCNKDGDTLHIFLGHLPSMLGGAAASEWKRQVAKDMVRHRVDSLLALNGSTQIIFMGDMNCSPMEDIPGLHNQMVRMEKKGLGTEKYQGYWSCLDQFYVSAAIEKHSQVRIFDAEWLQERDEKYLGLRPKRTFVGWKYQKDGYSDHLPIMVKWEKVDEK